MFKMIIVMIALQSLVLGQSLNKTVFDQKPEKPMLIGHTNRVAFADSAFAWWFNAGYDSYEPDSAIIEKINHKIKNVDITVIMGTWCSDSRNGIPHFYKIIDFLKYPFEKITLINVDRKKTAEEIDISRFNIELIPTYIFYRNGEELGRIIENPIETLELDLLKIIDK